MKQHELSTLENTINVLQDLNEGKEVLADDISALISDLWAIVNANDEVSVANESMIYKFSDYQNLNTSGGPGPRAA